MCPIWQWNGPLEWCYCIALPVSPVVQSSNIAPCVSLMNCTHPNILHVIYCIWRYRGIYAFATEVRVWYRLCCIGQHLIHIWTNRSSLFNQCCKAITRKSVIWRSAIRISLFVLYISPLGSISMKHKQYIDRREWFWQNTPVEMISQIKESYWVFFCRSSRF